MTLRQMVAFFNAHEDLQARKDYRAGVIASCVVNSAWHGEDFEPVGPHQFFASIPAPEAEKPSKRKKQDTDSILYAQLTALAAGAQIGKLKG